MKKYLVMIIAATLAACATHQTIEKPDQFDTALGSINAQLQNWSFEDGTQTSFEKLGHCRTRFTVTWSESASATRGVAAFQTTTEIDLSTDVRGAEHLAPYDDVKPDHIERWGEHIRLVFVRQVSSQFKSTAIGDTQASTEIYGVEFVTIGIAKHANQQDTERLVQALNSLLQLCQNTPSAQRQQPAPKPAARLLQERTIEVPLSGLSLAQFVPAIDATEEGGECVTLNLENGDSIVQLAFPQRKLAKRFVGIKYDSSGQRRTYSDTRNGTVMNSPTEPSTAVMFEFQRGSAWAMNQWPGRAPEISVGDIEAALDVDNLGSPRRMIDLLHTRCGAP